jgi:uncharacterized RDD family membrane protein YckC
MSTAPYTLPHRRTMPADATVHVTRRRVVATIIDGLLFGAGYYLMALAFGDIRMEGEAANWDSNLPIPWAIVYGLLVVAYYLLLEGYRGQTVGKMATGITVVSEATGRTPGIGAAAARTLLRLVDGLLGYAVAFVVTLTSAKRQRLGDMVAHTLVVRK